MRSGLADEEDLDDAPDDDMVDGLLGAGSNRSCYHACATLLRGPRCYGS